MLAFLERRLVYLPPPPTTDFAEVEALGGEEVWFNADDGTRLHGWIFAHENPQLALLYFHGNGDDAEQNADVMANLRDELQATVFIFDYRGYGHSEGTPSEAGIIRDGQAAQRLLAERMGVAPNEVVLYGRSIGGGVAVAVASELGARALVVHDSFADMVAVAAHHYSYLPVRMLMRNRYPSAERIKDYDGPFLQVHGTADDVVPLEYAKPLFEASPSKRKRFVEVENGGHYGPLSPSAFEEVKEFLHGL